MAAVQNKQRCSALAAPRKWSRCCCLHDKCVPFRSKWALGVFAIAASANLASRQILTLHHRSHNVLRPAYLSCMSPHRCSCRSRQPTIGNVHAGDAPETSQCVLLQVSSRLHAYERLGQEMAQLATAHREIDMELAHAEFTLKEFQRVAHEDG